MSPTPVSDHGPVWRAAAPYMRARKNDVHIPIAYDYALQLVAHFPDADHEVVLLAILLHDIGWAVVDQEAIFRDGFGPKMMESDVRIAHEKEGARLAREILEGVQRYDPDGRFLGAEQVDDVAPVRGGRRSGARRRFSRQRGAEQTLLDAWRLRSRGARGTGQRGGRKKMATSIGEGGHLDGTVLLSYAAARTPEDQRSAYEAGLRAFLANTATRPRRRTGATDRDRPAHGRARPVRPPAGRTVRVIPGSVTRQPCLLRCAEEPGIVHPMQ